TWTTSPSGGVISGTSRKPLNVVSFSRSMTNDCGGRPPEFQTVHTSPSAAAEAPPAAAALRAGRPAHVAPIWPRNVLVLHSPGLSVPSSRGLSSGPSAGFAAVERAGALVAPPPPQASTRSEADRHERTLAIMVPRFYPSARPA